MIKHVVVIRFVPGADQHAIDKFAMAVARLPDQIPKVVDFACGPDINKGEDPEFAENWDFVVMATFKTLSHYQTYATHPAHLALKENYLTGLLQDRAGVQIELAVP